VSYPTPDFRCYCSFHLVVFTLGFSPPFSLFSFAYFGERLEDQRGASFTVAEMNDTSGIAIAFPPFLINHMILVSLFKYRAWIYWRVHMALSFTFPSSFPSPFNLS